MKAFALAALLKLNSSADWAEEFVSLRMEFARKYQKRYLTSTIHETRFFQNVVDCLNGEVWEEPGEYGDNFRRMINDNKEKETKRM